MTKRPPTPADGPKAPPPSSSHAMRRGGARREVTERVWLKAEDGAVLEGWALNLSRGGLRAILEDKVVLGQQFEVTMGEGAIADRPARIVWVQEEPDGAIVGLEFLTYEGSPSAAPAVPEASEGELTEMLRSAVSKPPPRR